MRKIRNVVVLAAAAALTTLGLATPPAHAATVVTYTGPNVAGCPTAVNAAVTDLTLAIGAEAGNDIVQCSLANSEVRVVAELYLLPTGPGKNTVKVLTAVGRCNFSTDCRRTQGFAQAIIPPGIYKLMGTITVDNVGPTPPVTTTFESAKFMYLVNDLGPSPI